MYAETAPSRSTKGPRDRKPRRGDEKGADPVKGGGRRRRESESPDHSSNNRESEDQGLTRTKALTAGAMRRMLQAGGTRGANPDGKKSDVRKGDKDGTGRDRNRKGRMPSFPGAPRYGSDDSDDDAASGARGHGVNRAGAM